MDLFSINKNNDKNGGEKESKKTLVLASASPRRRELFALISDSFQCVSSDVEESFPPQTEVHSIPQYLAGKKAASISGRLDQSHVVIGCDTGVFTDGKMLGKPKDKDDAFNMLKTLQGREHSVITGCCITDGVSSREFSVCSYVWFYPLSDRDIWDYISTGEPFDKAGSYGIQGKGSLLVEKISGDYFNIVGLPVSRLARELKEFLEGKG